jgi:type IV pilus assembly protein PilA
MIKKFLKHFKYGQKGFTLIELIVVIGILGVLAGVAIPNVTRSIGKGKVEAANTDFASVQTAIAAYQADGNPIAGPMGADEVLAVVTPYSQQPVEYDYTLAYDAGQITITGVDGDPSKAFVAGLQWDDAHGKWMTIP